MKNMEDKLSGILTVSKRCDTFRAEMAEEKEMARSIRMHKSVWEALDADADRCLRSSNRQIEAILMAYYGLNDTELMDVEPARAKVSGGTGHQRFLAESLDKVTKKRKKEEGDHAKFLDDSGEKLKNRRQA